MYDEDFSINRRHYRRENANLPAQYFIKKQSARYQQCTIVNLSRSGAGVLFPPRENLPTGAPVFLDVAVPKSFEQLTLRGEIKRNYRQGGDLYGGIKFEALLPESVFSRLVIP
jgi:hypothetical protein